MNQPVRQSLWRWVGALWDQRVEMFCADCGTSVGYFIVAPKSPVVVLCDECKKAPLTDPPAF